MITRREYIERDRTDKEDDFRAFREYYGQFVSEYTQNAVAYQIGHDRLMASEDVHFNDIPLRLFDCIYIGQEPLRLVSEANGGGGYSLSDKVCIAKEAARLWVENRKKKEFDELVERAGLNACIVDDDEEFGKLMRGK